MEPERAVLEACLDSARRGEPTPRSLPIASDLWLLRGVLSRATEPAAEVSGEHRGVECEPNDHGKWRLFPQTRTENFPDSEEDISSGSEEQENPQRPPENSKDQEDNADRVRTVYQGVTRIGCQEYSALPIRFGELTIHPVRRSGRRRGSPPDDGGCLEDEPETRLSETEVEDRVLRGRKILRIAADSLPGGSSEGYAAGAGEEGIGTNLVNRILGEQPYDSLPGAVDEELVPACDDISLSAFQRSDDPFEPGRIEDAHIRDCDDVRIGESNGLVPPSGSISRSGRPSKGKGGPRGEGLQELRRTIRRSPVRDDDHVGANGLAVNRGQEFGETRLLVPDSGDQGPAHEPLIREAVLKRFFSGNLK